MQRLSLLIDRGGLDVLSTQIKRLVRQTWTAILCAEGESLKPETLFIIEYTTSGIIGLIANEIMRASAQTSPDALNGFLARNSAFLLEQIGNAQHHPRKDPHHPPRLPSQREALTQLQGARRGGADAAKGKGDLRPITLAASAPPPHRNSQISAKQKARPGLVAQVALSTPIRNNQRKFAKTGYSDIVWNLPSITALP